MSRPASDHLDKGLTERLRPYAWRRTLTVAGLLAAAAAWVLAGCSSSPATSGASPTPSTPSTPPGATAPAASSPASTGSASAPGMAISRGQAKRIAVKAVGGGAVIHAKTDHQGTILVWEIDVVRNGVKHEVDVNAATGKVMSNHVD